jgi:threonine/homoserine/homoserine lactone efflux protein
VESYTDLAVRGFVIGLAVAASVGPIWILCLRRTLESGFLAGFTSGAGAAVADAIYGGVSALGVSAIGGAVEGIAPWLGVAGGAALVYLGARDLLRRPASGGAAAPPGLLAGFATTFGLTLANPMTILLFAAIMAGLGVGVAGPPIGAILVVAGVFLGSLAWWLVLAAAGSRLRDRLGPSARLWITRASGLVLIGFGVVAMARLP